MGAAQGLQAIEFLLPLFLDPSQKVRKMAIDAAICIVKTDEAAQLFAATALTVDIPAAQCYIMKKVNEKIIRPSALKCPLLHNFFVTEQFAT